MGWVVVEWLGWVGLGFGMSVLRWDEGMEIERAFFFSETGQAY